MCSAANTCYGARLVLIVGRWIPDMPGCARPALSLPIVSNLAIEWIRRRAYSRNGLKKAIYDEQLLTPDFVANAQAAS